MNHTVNITWENKELTITGMYSYQGETHYQPSEEDCELQTIVWKGLDVTDLLLDVEKIYKELEEKFIEELQNGGGSGPDDPRI